MKVICFASATSDGDRLQRVIESAAPRERVLRSLNIEAFRASLRHSLTDSIIVVALAATREELCQILLIRDLLSDVRIILILPDQDPWTIANGHALRPRFVAFVDGDLQDVAAVLTNMIARTENKPGSRDHQSTIKTASPG